MKTEDCDSLGAARGIMYGVAAGALMWLIASVVYACFAN